MPVFAQYQGKLPLIRFQPKKNNMSKIHVTSPSGSQSQHEEDQLRSMWEQGLLQAGTQYWREGMVKWRPLSELFESPRPALPSSAPPPLDNAAFSYAKDPRSVTSFLVVMLWIGLGMEVVTLLSDCGQMSLLNRSYTETEAVANDARQRIIGLGYLGGYIVTIIAFSMWIYRANLNCRAFGAQDMKFTPGWSVGYYFIPLLSFVKPYESMKEIWQVSHNPTDWKSQKGSALLGWWWALWLISGVVGQMDLRLSMNAYTIQDFRQSTAMAIFSGFIGIPLYLVVLKLVKTIAAKQEQLVANVSPRPDSL